MASRTKRCILLAAVALAVAAWWLSRRRSAPSPAADVGAAATPEPLSAPTTEEPLPLWVPPVNGQCPPGYPVKANDNSGIFHLPGGRFYDRTVPERCYATEEGAEADGYRRSKA